MTRELLFSVTKKDFTVEHIRGSGPGGQHRNKTSTGVRITHPASGAVGEATDSRSQLDNKRAAFQRLVASPKFRLWLRMETGRAVGRETVEQAVERQVAPENLKWEGREDGRWKELP